MEAVKNWDHANWPLEVVVDPEIVVLKSPQNVVIHHVQNVLGERLRKKVLAVSWGVRLEDAVQDFVPVMTVFVATHSLVLPGKLLPVFVKKLYQRLQPKHPLKQSTPTK